MRRRITLTIGIPDADGDDLIGITDLLALLSLFAEADSDGDGIWDSVDDCIGVYDPCGVCNGTGEDADEDGLCDDVDDCVGEYDECGVCNGPGQLFLSSMKSCTPRIRYSLIRLMSGTCLNMRRIRCSRLCAL